MTIRCAECGHFVNRTYRCHCDAMKLPRIRRRDRIRARIRQRLARRTVRAKIPR